MNLLRFGADQQKSDGRQTENAVKRVIVVTAVVLASALSAHAASVKKHQRVANARACHEIVLTKNDAVTWAMGVASGQVPLPSVARMKQCFTRESNEAYARDNPHPEIFERP